MSTSSWRRPPQGAQATDVLRKHRPDYWLLVIAACLLAIGLVVVYSISPALSELRGGNYVQHQVIAIILRILAFLVTARIPLAVWRKWQWWLLGLAALGFVMVLSVIGRRWLARRSAPGQMPPDERTG